MFGHAELFMPRGTLRQLNRSTLKSPLLRRIIIFVFFVLPVPDTNVVKEKHAHARQNDHLYDDVSKIDSYFRVKHNGSVIKLHFHAITQLKNTVKFRGTRTSGKLKIPESRKVYEGLPREKGFGKNYARYKITTCSLGDYRAKVRLT